MSGEPKIFSKNYLNSDDTNTITSGASAIASLFDYDSASKWVSVGSDDSTEEVLDITFFEGSTAVSRTIDRIVFLNHNLKEYDIEKFDGGAFTNVHAEAADAAANTIITLSPFTDTRIRIRMKKTQVVDAQKSVGEILVLLKTVDFEDDPTRMIEKWRDKVSKYMTLDGTKEMAYSKKKSNRVSLYETNWRLDFAAQSFLDAMKAVKDAGLPFTFQPESVAAPERFFLVHWETPWNQAYSAVTKTSGYSLEGKFVEV